MHSLQTTHNGQIGTKMALVIITETSPGLTEIRTGQVNTTNTLETKMPVLLCQVTLGKTIS